MSVLRKFVFFIIFSLLAFSIYAASEKDFALKGIIYDPNSPDSAVAVINGDIFKKGETYKGYAVAEIGADYVILEAIGKEDSAIRLNMGRITYQQKPRSLKAVEEGNIYSHGGLAVQQKKTLGFQLDKVTDSKVKNTTAISQENVEAALPKGFKAQTQGNSAFNAGNILNLATETKAMSEMRQIFTAAAVLASMEEADSQGNMVRSQFNLQKMAENGSLPRYLASGRSGPYIFTIKPQGYEFEVYGDPVNAKSSLRHFLLDRDGIFHTEGGRPATSSSPALEGLDIQKQFSPGEEKL